MSACVFCLEQLTESDRTITFDTCGHTTHSQCFMLYVKHEYENNKNVACPLCRTVIIDKPATVCITVAAEPPRTTQPNNTNNGMKMCILAASTILFVYITSVYFANTT